MGKYTSKQLIGFILPSVVGILLFMIPIQVDDSWTIIVKLIADIIGDALAGFLPILCVAIVTVSAVLGVASLGKPSFITSYPIINETFTATPVWAVIRVVGCIFIWVTFLGLGLDADGEIAGPLGYISTGDAGGFVLGE
ncbi:MAG: YjiH family protein, partial [Eggerthellaceae bacterium]|nr:YjiH family protein [Eggerthellaceae bacterium]